jgi:hypothetical protein
MPRLCNDILACRTEALGRHLWCCDQCSAEVYSFHSCKNRSCPKCHTDHTERWLAARKAEVLPCSYFHVTIITNNRIVGLDSAGVTLRHKHRPSNRWRTIRLSGEEFMRRFLQHVLAQSSLLRSVAFDPA